MSIHVLWNVFSETRTSNLIFVVQETLAQHQEEMHGHISGPKAGGMNMAPPIKVIVTVQKSRSPPDNRHAIHL